MIIFVALLLRHETAQAWQTWVVGSGAGARAVASAIADGPVVDREASDLKKHLPPRFIVHQGPVDAATLRWLRLMRATGARLVNVGDPERGRGTFSLIVSPRFEALPPGSNVLRTNEWPTPVHGATLTAIAKQRSHRAGALPTPVTAVLLSAPRDGRTYTVAFAAALGERVRREARAGGGSLAVIFAPGFTEAAARAFTAHLTGVPALVIAEGDAAGELDVLARADRVVVAGGSVDLLAAAVATGARVFMDAPDVTISERFKRFALELIAADRARLIRRLNEDWSAAPHLPSSRLADLIRARLGCAARLER